MHATWAESTSINNVLYLQNILNVLYLHLFKNSYKAFVMDIYPSIEEKHFIEDIGLFFEQMGMPRMAGRILGLLLISDPPAQSITELGDKLHASKSSISMMARLLVENGLVERVASPVPRRDYYRFKPGGWVLYMRQWLELMTGLHDIAERGLNLMRSRPPELQERLQEAHDLFSLVEERFPALLNELENNLRQKSR
jgi:DNA-binding transcriptional regulator GbsR (MarR family)